MKTTEDLLKTVGDGMIAATTAIKDLQAENLALKDEVQKLKTPKAPLPPRREKNPDDTEVSPVMKEFLEHKKKTSKG